jgi:chloramphenicol O-acetyltransferase type B
MRVKFVEDCLWFLYQSWKYKNASVSFSLGSRLQKSQLDRDLKIGKSFIYNSEINRDSSIGDNCHIFNSCLEAHVSIYSDSNIIDSTIGRFTYIAGQSNLNLVKVGKFCSIGSQILCGSGEHPTDFVSTHPVFFSNLKQCGISFTEKNLFEERKEITIGNDVWIGSRVFVRDGVKIGNGAIVGAGSVVVKDVPDYAIVGGVPAKVIRFRFTEDIIKKLQSIEWWNLSEEILKEVQPLIAQKDIHLFIRWYENNRRDS